MRPSKAHISFAPRMESEICFRHPFHKLRGIENLLPPKITRRFLEILQHHQHRIRVEL
jgi:hypothetical protein